MTTPPKGRHGSPYYCLEHRLICNSILSTDSYYQGTPCWVWIGKRNANEYPQLNLWIPGRGMTSVLAHRLSLEVFRGIVLQPGEKACHGCYTPLCINPMHIWPGTHSDNMRDAYAKGRLKLPNGLDR